MVILCFSKKKKPVESQESQVESGKGTEGMGMGMGKPAVAARESSLGWAGG